MIYGGIMNFLKGLWKLFLDFIGFLFDLDFNDEEEQETPFSNIPESGIPNPKNRVYDSNEAEILEMFFGKNSAENINQLRQEVDTMVEEHQLVKSDSILTVFPPQKLTESYVPYASINSIIESVYAQFDGDVILKPGKINVFVSDSGLKFAEMYIECYKPSEELLLF